uniref:hypothetical protein n=1 Tax=Nocardia donostiensis TaxID=1538463 RepID=UPI00159495D4|nr:hypothetical protein [Nocardia donostiensis]
MNGYPSFGSVVSAVVLPYRRAIGEDAAQAVDERSGGHDRRAGEHRGQRQGAGQ